MRIVPQCPVNKVHATEVHKVTVNNTAHLWITHVVGTRLGSPVKCKNAEAGVEVLVHAGVVVLELEAGVQRALPLATSLVALKLVPEVSLLTVPLVVPPVLG